MNTSSPYTAPTICRSETPCSFGSGAGDPSDMGVHRINRKRVRHRPSRSRRHFLETHMSRSVLPPDSQLDMQWASATAIPPSFASPTLQAWSAVSQQHRDGGNSTLVPSMRSLASGPPSSGLSPSTLPQLQRIESEGSRDRRIFGGDEADSEPARDLRGPMLDIVLGLFNGLDYEDDDC